MNGNTSPNTLLLRAAHFAAEKHRNQRRKGADQAPYINHPLEVARILAEVGGVTDPTVLAAALLHDTIEDTDTTAGELDAEFGPEVRQLVEEVTDDKKLPKAERKQLQIEHAPHLSAEARQIKLADKLCNVRDLGREMPENWTRERCLDYFDWADRVVAGCRGVNAVLEARFDEVVKAARAAF